MEENQLSDETDQTKSLWCPGCLKQTPLDDEGLIVTFTPQAWKVDPDGTVDTGYDPDVFMDYDHLPCGTHVRLVSNAGWSEELGDYVVSAQNVFLEVTIRGEYQSGQRSIVDYDLNPDLRDIEPFSDSLENSPNVWGSTYNVLLDMYKEALRLLKEQIGDDE